MLQTSQIEKPRCSAKIDQIRLRRAINLPLDSQYFSSSGFQFEIQAVGCLLISVVSLRSRSVQTVFPGFRPGAEETPPHRRRRAAVARLIGGAVMKDQWGQPCGGPPCPADLKRIVPARQPLARPHPLALTTP